MVTAEHPQITQIPWSEFLPEMPWRQGEHVTLIGPTGMGKTTLGLNLLPKRRFVLILATKPKDPLLSKLQREGYYLSREWPVSSRVHEKVIYWPKIHKMEHSSSQMEGLASCLENVYESGGWCVFLDEIRYLSERGLRAHLELLYLQGRSLGVSMVGATQRPAWIPLEAYSSATHMFLWRDQDGANLKRIGDMGGVNTRLVKEIVQRLPKHDVLYVNTRTGDMAITRSERR